ncbi:hypothetical protein, conserved in T. vivax [Trypanosoma vivax Y486]|uniref:Uncharacterized protein n=1 Tax=Trypanosoma vivax (strain Y486) TaxID=1055687 RepID=F9WMY1_TRYVY|nr:hypothetical protein, conserved in T. vivax [Trypanosoma vivax Y486]|eukprot:CCD18896.1 hypothetical protein, conserved in T. vivax [Trypanosoma vivax Y486]
MVEDISGIKDAGNKLVADATVSMHNCTSVAKLAKEGALLGHGATGADDKAQYAKQNCTMAVREVSMANEKALAFGSVATGAKDNAVKLQGQLTEIIREKKKHVEKAKGTFAEILKNATVNSQTIKVENACEAVNFSEYVTTFERAEKIFPQLCAVDSFGVDDVKRNITTLEGLVSSAGGNLSRAQSNVVLSKESSKNAEKYVSEMRVFARAVFKDVMETQRRELCNAVQRLVETNQRPSVVISQTNDNRNNARRQRDRAKDAVGVASGAAARSASADAHTSEVPGKLRETSDVVTGTLVLSRSVMRDGKKLQKENEVQVQEIHKTIASVLNNVTDRQGAVTENVCAAAMSYSVTGALKDSLDAVKTLASLGNITGALTRFDYLQGREKQVEAMLNASKERADGAERGALAALKVAKDARSTLLFFHLFRKLNNLG